MTRLRLLIPAAAVCSLLFANSAAASEALARKGACTTCHAVDKKLIGPSYREVAAKYKGHADALALLTERVRKGGKGVWGNLPMPPTDAAKISDADLQTVLTWVLKTPG
jgi:cytochrome c